MLNSKGKILIGLTSGRNGDFPPFVIADKSIAGLQISALGKTDVYLETNSLFGTDVEMTVYMDHKKSLRPKIFSKTERFIIQKKNLQSVILKPIDLDMDVKINLKKIN